MVHFFPSRLSIAAFACCQGTALSGLASSSAIRFRMISACQAGTGTLFASADTRSHSLPRRHAVVPAQHVVGVRQPGVGQGVAGVEGDGFVEMRDALACRRVGATVAPSSSTEYSVTMFGWLSEATALASRSKRATLVGSLANDSGRTLIATSRPSRVSFALQTTPIPPWPIWATRR